jgi:hypothetical protein
MFLFFKSRNIKKRSILEKQRVKSGSEKPRKGSRLSWSSAAQGLILIFALTIIWGLGIRLVDKFQDVTAYLNSILVLAPGEWQVDVVSTSGAPLPEDVRREIYNVASKQLRLGTPKELSSLAHQVEGLGTLDSVKVIRPLAGTVILSAQMRQPALLVSVGSKVRYLTLDGTVFGDDSIISESSSWVRPTVLVTGIFDQRMNPAMDDSLRVIVTPDERRHLTEAIELWQLALEASFSVKAIGFQKFRGYVLSMAEETEIVIGPKPFEYKLKKLRGILDGLKREGTLAARIELDYGGKAFIKERKL